MGIVKSTAAATLLIVVAACSTAAQQAKQMAPGDVVASVGSTPVTLAEVDAIALQEPVSNFGGARLVQALYLARRAALDEVIATRLIAQEAKVRGLAADVLTTQEVDGTVKAPTDADRAGRGDDRVETQ